MQSAYLCICPTSCKNPAENHATILRGFIGQLHGFKMAVETAPKRLFLNRTKDAMKHNTLLFDEKPGLTYKASHQKLSLAISLAAALIAFALSVCTNLFWSHAAFALVQPLAFLAVGVLHINGLEKNFRNLSHLQKWVYAIMIAVTIFLLFGLSSYWKLHLSLLSMVTGPLAFLLPAVVAETFRNYIQLTLGQGSVWQPTREAFITYPDVYMKGIPVLFHVLTEPARSDNVSTTFRVLPEMKLGEAFCNMTQKQANKGTGAVSLFDDEKKLYHWTFFTRNTLGLSRVLDPNLSLVENNLGKKSVVFAQRLPANVSLINQEQAISNSFV